MHDVDRAYEHYLALSSTFNASDDANEATVRLKSINTLLFDVLGWDKSNVDPEKYCREQAYADYACSDASGLALIVEAKRASKTFVLSDVKYSEKPVSLHLLSDESPAAEDALRQALTYALFLGARYVAISNGDQWILALTFVEKQHFKDRSVLVFESYIAIQDRFRLFFDCLSPQGVLANNCRQILSTPRTSPPPQKLSQKIHNYPRPALRNQLSNQLSAVLGAVWKAAREDEFSPEFLGSCYVTPESTATTLALASELIRSRLSADQKLYATAIAPKDASSVISAHTDEKPIVVLGHVGNGKTMFLNYLRVVSAKESLKKYIQIDIDFLHLPDSAADVPRYVYDQVEEQLYVRYGIDISDDKRVRAALNSDLNRFRRTPEAIAFEHNRDEYAREEIRFIQNIRSDRHTYLKKVFADIRGAQQYSVAIFLDNLDRRSPDIQECAYLKASAMARDWSAVVFVCLRPSTFYSSKAFGVLDSVAPVVINVAPPRADIMVLKRLQYASRIANGDKDKVAVRGPRLSEGIALQLPSVSKLLDYVAHSFRKNRGLADLFTAISNGNARELLVYVYDFLVSMHLDTEEIFMRWDEGKNPVPVHHALRAILYGDHMHYDPGKSPFINLFDIEHSDSSEHCSRLCALVYLNSIADGHPTYRFCKLEELYDHLQHHGYRSVHVVSTIQYLFEKKCIESRDPLELWRDGVRDVRITSLGRYHVTELCRTFQYLDAVSVDTPVLNQSAVKLIQDVWKIDERLQRAQAFADYLDDCSRQVSDERVVEVWADVYSCVSGEIGIIFDAISDRMAAAPALPEDRYFPN